MTDDPWLKASIMAKRGLAKGRTGKTERHVRLTHFLLGTPAWKSLDPVARALLVEVMQRYTGFNNGTVGLGVRQAAAAPAGAAAEGCAAATGPDADDAARAGGLSCAGGA